CREDRRFMLGNKHNYSDTAIKVEPQDAAIDGTVIAYELRKIIHSYFPDFQKELRQIADHRQRQEYSRLADALYANNRVMGICENNEWKYIITLKEDNLPALQGCLKDDPPTGRNSFVHHPACTVKDTTVTLEFYWVQDLLHKKHQIRLYSG
ncbi:hypothetical protein, partial [Agriterribacter sp.]|uniref:hypothetical protein n=1 Tax=Agriterribacter sp. TaxID=2821509 RepID=UPI002D0C18C5